MTEVIGFSLVQHFFSEIDDGLSSTDLDPATKS
jgi:hypothetical protein